MNRRVWLTPCVEGIRNVTLPSLALWALFIWAGFALVECVG